MKGKEKNFVKHFMLWRKKRNVRKGFIFHSKSSEISTDIETFLKLKCDQKTYIFLMSLVMKLHRANK